MQKWWILAILLLCVVIVIYFWRQSNQQPQGYPQGPKWLVMIPGITGDLAKRKLIPALYQLYTQGTRCYYYWNWTQCC